MTLNSRKKGKVGELEAVALLREFGFDAQRTSPLQAAGGTTDADVKGIDGVHLEVKRCERVEIDKWCAQAELATSPGDVPAVAWRRSRQRWRVALPLTDFLRLVRRAES